MHQSVQAGRRLSVALAAHDKLFDALYVNLVKSGEASGSLAAVLELLADHREKTDTFRTNVVSAPQGFGIDRRGDWRLGAESNRCTRLCRPLHDHSAT